MARPELAIALTDDWELRGNGLGDVQELQVRPATRLMDLYQRQGIRATFVVEVMQQLAFEACADRYPDIARQRDLWIETVRSMRSRGFDVQLHIHPQWYRAEYDGRWWKLNRRWHIADYSRQEIWDMVGHCVEYLSKLIAPARISSFRGGSWGMGPPSRDVLETLLAFGIRIDVSVVQGSYYDGEVIRLNYTRLECPNKAYPPDLDDIRKVGDKASGLVEIPTQSVPKKNLISTIRLKSPRHVMAKLLAPLSRARSEPLPSHIVHDPFGMASGRGRMDHIFDFSSEYSSYGLKVMADFSIERALKVSDRDFLVLVFENHSKDLQRDRQFRSIESTIRHIREKYPDITFVTLSQVAERAAELV